jgi:outer membrane protein assembly factor BamB
MGAFAWLAACGARTGLSSYEPADAGAGFDALAPIDVAAGVRDAVVVPPPHCSNEVPVGAIRGKVEHVDSRAAIDDGGNLYALRMSADRKSASVIALDPCLRLLWQSPLDGWMWAYGQSRVMVDGNGDVWVMSPDADAKQTWRFASDGTPKRIGVDLGSDLRTVIAVPDEGGPVFVTGMFRDLRLKRVDAQGRLDAVAVREDQADLYDGECFALPDTIGCADIAFDRASLAKLWVSPNTLLLDGTFRHVLPPASDGASSYLVEYGISTYQLRAREVRTGRVRFTTQLTHTTMGQVGILLGPPVISATGLVILYVSAHRQEAAAEGQLEAFHSDGRAAWTFAAQRTARPDPNRVDAIFSDVATHVAGTSAIYLAVGRSVYAVREEDGRLLWQIDGLGDVNEPGTNLSPNGDLYVRNLDGVLYAIRTESSGPAPSMWPVPGGGHRLNRSN